MCGVDGGADVAFLLGVHAKAGTAHAVLDHTWSSSRVHACYFNGVELGEIGINAALAGHFRVPVALVVGDQAAVQEAEDLLGPTLKTLAVKQGLSRQSARHLPLRARAGPNSHARPTSHHRMTRPEPYRMGGPVTVSIEFANSLQAEGASALCREHGAPAAGE